jgi:hypothetical protein
MKVSQISNLCQGSGARPVGDQRAGGGSDPRQVGDRAGNSQPASGEMVYLREVLEAPIYIAVGLAVDAGLWAWISVVIRWWPTWGKCRICWWLGPRGPVSRWRSTPCCSACCTRRPPAKCGLILVDPKMLELSMYEDIPHLLTPVVTDMKEAANALALVRGRDGAPLPADGGAEGAQHRRFQPQARAMRKRKGEGLS